MKLETFFSISQQTRLFLMAVIIGVFLGILFDVFRVIRIIFPPAKKELLVCLLDIIFLLCYAIVIFLYSVLYGAGQVRFFYFLGSLIGFVIYIVSIGNVITGVIRAVVNAVYKSLQQVYSIIIEPLVKIKAHFSKKRIVFFVKSHKVKDK